MQSIYLQGKQKMFKKKNLMNYKNIFVYKIQHKWVYMYDWKNNRNIQFTKFPSF